MEIRGRKKNAIEALKTPQEERAKKLMSEKCRHIDVEP